MDLAGHAKYLKTTVGGLVGHQPDYVMLVVDAAQAILEIETQGMILGRMSREHLGIALALELRVFVVITKAVSGNADLVMPQNTATHTPTPETPPAPAHTSHSLFRCVSSLCVPSP